MTKVDPAPLTRWGARVRVVTPVRADLEPYRVAVQTSRDRLAPWNPVNPSDLAYHLGQQGPQHRTFLIRALEPQGEHDIVGKVNVTNVARGRALSGTLGYDAYDPYAGTGLFSEGLGLVIDLALSDEPEGMGLFRVEAAVQPGNVRSAGMLRRLGLRRRGTWPDYLWLADARGRDSWRDHVVYGVTRRQWLLGRGQEWVATRPARPLVVLQASDPGSVVASRATAAARAVAAELGVPVVRDDAPQATSRLGERLADAVTGAVVVTAASPQHVAEALVAGGFDVGPVVARLDGVRDARDIVALALDARAAAGVDDAG